MASQSYFCISQRSLSMKNSADLLRFSTLLEFYVTCDRRGYQNLLFIRYFDRKNKEASTASNDARRRRQTARGNWPKIMNGEIRGGHSFVKFKPCENGKCSGRIDQGSDGAAVDYALVLFHLVTNFEMNACLSVFYLAEFEAEKLCVR